MADHTKILCRIFLAAALCLIPLSGCSKQSAPLNPASDTERNTENAAGDGTEQAGGLGDFALQDINGVSYTKDLFAEYDLTMVNVFATWCTPCVDEIPDLEKLRNELLLQSAYKANIIGIVLDTADGEGNRDEEGVRLAQELAETTGASYPFLVPDAKLLNGRLAGIESIPETFFVDKNGTIVGETYSGSRSLDDWREIVETEVSNLSGLKGNGS